MQQYNIKDSQVITFKDIRDNKVTVPLSQVSRIGINSDGQYLVWVDSYFFKFEELGYGTIAVSKETYLDLLKYFES